MKNRTRIFAFAIVALAGALLPPLGSADDAVADRIIAAATDPTEPPSEDNGFTLSDIAHHVDRLVSRERLDPVTGVRIRPYTGNNTTSSGTTYVIAQTRDGKGRGVMYFGRRGRQQFRGRLFSLNERALNAGFEIVGLSLINDGFMRVLIGPGNGKTPVYHFLDVYGKFHHPGPRPTAAPRPEKPEDRPKPDDAEERPETERGRDHLEGRRGDK